MKIRQTAWQTDRQTTVKQDKQLDRQTDKQHENKTNSLTDIQQKTEPKAKRGVNL